jgi:hypothetical protein
VEQDREEGAKLQPAMHVTNKFWKKGGGGGTVGFKDIFCTPSQQPVGLHHHNISLHNNIEILTGV